MAFVQINFVSKYLGVGTPVSILLPDRPNDMEPRTFYESGKKYKVLWLLHGSYDDHTSWVHKTNIELYAMEKDLIVVMPNALNSNYANWPEFGMGFNMYDFLLDELMPMIYNWFPASPKREDNFIAGLSMGGRGTCVYAFNHPEKFAAAAILSAAPRDFDVLKTMEPKMYERTMQSVRNYGSVEAYKASYENTWRIFQEKAHTGELPHLYFSIGTEDWLYPTYLRFKEKALEIGLDATFEEVEGYCHEWRFWDLGIQKALEFFGL